MAINPFDGEYNFRLCQEIQPEPHLLAEEFASVLAAAASKNAEAINAEIKDWIEDVEFTEQHSVIVQELTDGEQSCIILGVYVQEHPQAEVINWIAEQVARLTNSNWGYMTQGCNAAGNKMAGAVPNQSEFGGRATPGKNAKQMLTEGLKGYLLHNCEPDVESLWAKDALNNFEKAECVISLTSYADGRISEYSTVMLPVAGNFETSGTFVNIEGRWQSFAAAVPAPGESRPAWKVLRVLGNLLDLAGFEYENSVQIRDELKEKQENSRDKKESRKTPPPLCPASKEETERESLGLYMVDPMVRRAKALQQTPKASTHPISISRVKT